MSENKKDVLKDHEFDGIREYDNNLPRWWLGTFYLTVLFGIGYWFYYHVTSMGPNQATEYNMAKEALATQSSQASGGDDNKNSMTDESFVALSHDQDDVAEGKVVYDTNCMACHGPQAGGVIGPNLTDNFWIHGGKPTQIKKTIEAGVLDKGMLAWKGVLNDSQINNVVAYVMSLEGSNPPNAKPPQGDPK